jgi:hypothetical protein
MESITYIPRHSQNIETEGLIRKIFRRKDFGEPFRVKCFRISVSPRKILYLLDLALLLECQRTVVIYVILDAAVGIEVKEIWRDYAFDIPSIHI